MAKECAKYAVVPEDNFEQREHVHKMRDTCTNTLIYKLGLPPNDPFGYHAAAGGGA